ncbi:MAG: type I secretion system permease/ATPase [Methyloligellaceae bacterium]
MAEKTEDAKKAASDTPKQVGPARTTPLARGFRLYKTALTIVAIFSVAINLLLLTIPIYLLQLSDRVLLSRSTDTLILLTVLAVGAIMVLSAFESLRRMILSRVAARIETELGAPVLVSSVRGALAGLEDENQGLRDLAQIRTFVSSPVLPLMIDIPLVPFYILIVFLIHFQLGAITTIGALVLLLLAFANQALTAGPQRRAGQHAMTAMATAHASTRNAEVVQAMGMLPESIDLWGRENAKSIMTQMRANDRSAMVTGLSKFVRLALQIAVLGWGAYLAVQGEITGGMMIAASMIGSRALAPIEGTIEGWRSFVQMRQATKRVRMLLAAGMSQPVATKLPDPKGEIFVENLVYGVKGVKRPLVNQVTFGVRPGDSVAIIGPSGAGKSTLARLLVGALIPSAGHVRLDQADIMNWDREQFGRNTGYLPQDVELFPGTVAQNIARLHTEASPEDVTAAARFAGAHQLITRLPGGYETQVRIGGAPLSGGQRQRIALARAFFGMPVFVTLDEPDSNLDADGERALVQTLLRAKKQGITTVTITQRPLLLQFVDKLLVMKDGRVEAYGPRDAVLPKLMEQARPAQIARGQEAPQIIPPGEDAEPKGDDAEKSGPKPQADAPKPAEEEAQGS